MKKFLLMMMATGLIATTSGCSTVYNSAMENVFGVEKRQLLKSAVTKVSKDQKKAQEDFQDAMTRMKELYAFDGGNLEQMYNKLKGTQEDAQGQADKLRSRINNMENVAKSMFSEWEKEIKEFTNATFASDSRRQLNETRQRYSQLSSAVRASENSMKPVLKQLNDHVLYLKHNLNAASIGALKGEAASIESSIEQLIQQMNSSISEADEFLRTFNP